MAFVLLQQPQLIDFLSSMPLNHSKPHDFVINEMGPPWIIKVILMNIVAIALNATLIVNSNRNYLENASFPKITEGVYQCDLQGPSAYDIWKHF